MANRTTLVYDVFMCKGGFLSLWHRNKAQVMPNDVDPSKIIPLGKGLDLFI